MVYNLVEHKRITQKEVERRLKKEKVNLAYGIAKIFMKQIKIKNRWKIKYLIALIFKRFNLWKW